jgi:hypothetical protein
MAASDAVRLNRPPAISELLKPHTYIDKALGGDFKVSLVEDASLEYRVYVLECRGPRGEKLKYVGFCHFSELRHRMRKHWDGAVHYTKMYPPQKILYLWPAASEAAEAYIYYELLRSMGPNETWMLGGFVQTSSKPSRLDCLLAEQARRGMKELCFNCGQRRFEGEHKRLRKCPFALRGVGYGCPVAGCKGALIVTSRGHAEAVPEPPAAPQQTVPKRPAPAPTVAQPVRKICRMTKAVKPSANAGLIVNICNEQYSAVSWFVKNEDPPKKACTAARAQCADGAMELIGGHVRALVGTAYARAPPRRPKPLCRVGGEDRARMGDEPVATEVAGCQVQRVKHGRLTRRLSQVLFRVDALKQVFPDAA